MGISGPGLKESDTSMDVDVWVDEYLETHEAIDPLELLDLVEGKYPSDDRQYERMDAVLSLVTTFLDHKIDISTPDLRERLHPYVIQAYRTIGRYTPESQPDRYTIINTLDAVMMGLLAADRETLTLMQIRPSDWEAVTLGLGLEKWQRSGYSPKYAIGQRVYVEGVPAVVVGRLMRPAGHYKTFGEKYPNVGYLYQIAFVDDDASSVRIPNELINELQLSEVPF